MRLNEGCAEVNRTGISTHTIGLVFSIQLLRLVFCTRVHRLHSTPWNGMEVDIVHSKSANTFRQRKPICMQMLWMFKFNKWHAHYLPLAGTGSRGCEPNSSSELSK